MELLAGLEPATSTYDHPSAAAALGAPVSKRRALPFQLQELKHCRLSICDCRLVRYQVTNRKSAIGNWQCIWSGRTELNCHHEFPGLGCCVTPHPEDVLWI